MISFSEYMRKEVMIRMSKTIALIGTFDSKGKEFLFIKELIESLGFNTFTIHSGVFEPQFEPDVNNNEVIQAAGEDIQKIVDLKDRAYATAVLAKGMEILLPKLYKENKFDGVLSFGGTGGTSISTPGMRALPIGVPKIDYGFYSRFWKYATIYRD